MNPINVLIVDDAVVVRGFLRNMIEKDTALKVIASASDGKSGVRDYKTFKPDITLMDIEMPGMSGLDALVEILRFDPAAKVIMCSSLTQAGAEASYQSLHLGALDCVAKPSSRLVDRGISFETELLTKIKTLAYNANVPSPAPTAQITRPPGPIQAARPAPKPAGTGLILGTRPLPADLPKTFPLALAIGSSTGGPTALTEVLKSIDKNIAVPIFITQHMPEGFTRFLAENLQKRTGFRTHEAADGMVVEAGHIYVSPGQKHLTLQKGYPNRIVLSDGPLVNFCKPSIEVMVDSIAETYGGQIIAVYLTGMGSDGKDAARRLVLGGRHNVLIAQDQASSVVWGIPGAVAKENLCHAILPLPNIAAAVNNLIKLKTLT